MAETIDEFLVDFYKQKNNEDVSSEKISEIKEAYGNDYDGLITDLYSKYDDGGLDDNKLSVIKNDYELNGVDVQDVDVVEEKEEKDLHGWMDIETEDVFNQKPSELVKTLKGAYPGFEITTTKASGGIRYTGGLETGVNMLNPKTGESIDIKNRRQYGSDKEFIDGFKQTIKTFVDKQGIDEEALIKQQEKSEELLNKVNKETSVSAEEQKNIVNKFSNNSIFDEYEKTITASVGSSFSMGTGGTYEETVVVKPYEEELKQAKDLLEKQINQENLKRSTNDKIPAPTNDQIKDFARSILVNKETLELKDNKWTNFLEANDDDMQAVLKYYKRKEYNKDFKKVASLQELQEVSIKEFESDDLDGDKAIVDEFEKTYYTPGKNFSINQSEDLIELSNGKTVSKTVFDEYSAASIKLNNKYQDLLNRQKIIDKKTDNLSDVNDQLDLLRRDYNNWNKMAYNIGTGFATIGAGISYGVGKGVQGLTYFMEDYDGSRVKSKAVGDFLDKRALEFTKFKEESRDKFSKDVNFENAFSSPSSFGRFIAQEVGQQIPILATIAASGGTASLYVIGGYAGGEKYMEMDVEDIKSGKERSELEKFGVSIGYGAAESIFERLTTVEILKRGKNYLKNASNGRIMLKDVDEAIKQTFKNEWKRVLISEPSLEAGGEGLTQMTQNLLDGKPLMENVGHAMFSGGMFGFSMSASPVMYGMAVAKFQNPKLYDEYNSTISEIAELNKKLDGDNLTADTRKILRKERKDLTDKANANLMEIEQLTLNSMSPQAFNKYNSQTAAQELIRNEAENILNNKQFTKKEKQEKLQKLQDKFNKIQRSRDLFRNHKSFGNKFVLLETGSKEDQLRYEELKQQAIENIRIKKNESAEYVPDGKEVMQEAYDLFIQDQITSRVDQAKKSEGVNIELIENNKQAIEIVNESNLSDKDKKELIDGIKDGSLNGVDDIGGSSYVFMQNAISNEKSSTSVHEPGHEVFKKILKTRSGDFNFLQEEITNWLAKNDIDMLNVIYMNMSKSDNPMIQSEEFVMEFLEQIDQGNINFKKANNKKLATLFGFMSSNAMKKNGFDLDLKGQDDAVSFLINLAGKIKTGTLTEQDIVEARESKVIKKVKEDTDNAAIINKVLKEVGLKKSLSETPEERKTRQDNRNKLLDKVYNEQALDENGKPVSKQEFGEFLNTKEGKDFVGEVLMSSYNDMLAIVKGDELKIEFDPLIKLINAFDPQKKVREGKFDLKGYFGRFLKVKTQTGSKQVAKTDAPKGVVRIDQEREGARDIQIKDTSKTPDVDTKAELNFRNKLKIETGGNLYNSILKKAKIILSTLPTSLKVPKTNTTLKEVKAKLQENPNNNKAVGDLNRIFKDFRKTLKNAFDTQLFKEIKDSMGTREAYKEYLRSNKEAILTSLPIADLVAMQKAKGADKILAKPIKENLSPNEIKQYEGSQDLMYTSPTSGPTLYERLNPTSKEFVDFMSVKGRKDALARNIAGKLGENATMQTLAGKDVMDAFLIKNPTLKNIPTDMLVNSIAQAIDSGVGMKFSSSVKTNEISKLLKDVDENLGLSIDSQTLKDQVRDVVDTAYPEKLTGKAKIVNELVKYLKPFTRQIAKFPDIKINIENYIKSLVSDNVVNNYGKAFGIKNLTEVFRTKNKEQRAFQRLLAKEILKLKDDNGNLIYSNPLSLAAEYWQYKAMMEDGSANPSRAMTFYSKEKRGHVKVFIDEFIASVFSDELNPITSVKNTTTIKKVNGKKVKIDQVQFTYKDKSIKFVDSPRRAKQEVTQDMIDNSVSKEELEQRKLDANRAFNFVVNQYKAAKNLLDKKLANNENIAMLAAGMGANMKGPIRAAAMLRYLPVNSKYKSLRKPTGGKAFEYEHGIPAVIVNLTIADAVLNPKSEVDLKKLQESYTVGVIDVDFNDNFGRFFKSRMPFDYKIGDLPTTRWYNEFTTGGDVHALYDLKEDKIVGEEEAKLWKEIQKAKTSNIETLSNDVVKFSKNETNNEIIGYAKTVDEALAIARDINAPVKKIRVFDFDDTLATTKSDVLFTAPDGTKGKLNAEEFAKQGSQLLEEGYVFDFSEFNKVTDGKPGPLLDIAKKIQEARGTEDVFVLTARAPEAQVAIKEFLDSVGLNIPLKNITGLGNSTGAAKANWIVDKAANGYNDFYFADDAYQNVKAVQDALDQIDVKSEVQQAKIKFSKTLNEDFNKIIENTTGVAADKVYSKAKAQVRGANKGRFKFFIPYSAEDFLGLIYPTLSKGNLGDAQMAWYKKHILDPYTRAMESLSADRIQLMEDFKALKKALDVPKNLRKVNDSGFTNEQAVRVYLWNKMGYDIPGLSKTDLNELNTIVESDGLLKAFADQILNLTKGDGYSKPTDNWLVGTITTDLVELINTTKRSKYLEEWQQNIDEVYSQDNLNKLEAIYGSKYVEALKSTLSRMKSGKNRAATGNRLSNRILDYINGSVGAIMFFNTRSAVLQTISSINFVNWSFNNPLMAGKAFANQPQYWKDFKELMNSDYLVDRRNGLKLNISESEIADAAATSKNKAKAALNYLLQKGFLPTQMADSFAIASGGATFYRNRINDLIKNKGLTEAEAKAQAMLEFRQIAETSQQSSDPSKISQQQSSDVGRLLLAFANTPMQYARMQKRAAQDLINGRGDAKSNISKIIYYGFVQNLIFNALQQAVNLLGFGDDEEKEEEEYKKKMKIANGMADSLLRGLGIGGQAVSVGKNFLLDIYERSERKRPEYVDAMWKLMQFSPPISSKISKLKQAAWHFDSKKRREKIFEKGFSLDNPAYEAGAKVISATTNLPLDRVYSKVNNIEGSLAEDLDVWQRLAMLGGWPEWQINPKDDKQEVSNLSNGNVKVQKLKPKKYVRKTYTRKKYARRK